MAILRFLTTRRRNNLKLNLLKRKVLTIHPSIFHYLLCGFRTVTAILMSMIMLDSLLQSDCRCAGSDKYWFITQCHHSVLPCCQEIVFFLSTVWHTFKLARCRGLKNISPCVYFWQRNVLHLTQSNLNTKVNWDNDTIH